MNELVPNPSDIMPYLDVDEDKKERFEYLFWRICNDKQARRISLSDFNTSDQMYMEFLNKELITDTQNEHLRLFYNVTLGFALLEGFRTLPSADNETLYWYMSGISRHPTRGHGYRDFDSLCVAMPTVFLQTKNEE